MKSFFKNSALSFFYSVVTTLLICGCAATGPLKGVNAQGEKVYLGPVPIENTEAFQDFLHSSRTEVDKQRYLFRRLKDSIGLEFFHDDAWYNAIEAYRGGMWLMRNRYKKGQDSREFIEKYVKRSETSGKYHLVKYPDGSIQMGSAVLLNELDLLEKASKEHTAETNPNHPGDRLH